MVGKSFASKEMVKFLGQLRDCLINCKEYKDRAQITDCIAEAKQFSDVTKYSECINSSKHMFKFTECVNNTKTSCNLETESSLLQNSVKVDKGYEKLLKDLDVVLQNQDLVNQSTENFLKNEDVLLVLNDISKLHCDLMTYTHQMDSVLSTLGGCISVYFIFGFIIWYYGGLHLGP